VQPSAPTAAVVSDGTTRRPPIGPWPGFNMPIGAELATPAQISSLMASHGQGRRGPLIQW
jgi:hypothetical protein